MRQRFKQGLTEHKQTAGNEMTFLCQAMQIATDRWRTKARNRLEAPLQIASPGAVMLSVLPLCWQQYSALQQRKSSSLLPSDTILHQTHAGQDGKHPGTKGKHFGGDLVRKLQLLHSTFTGQQGCAAGAGPEQGTALPAAQPWPRVQVAHCTELQSPQIGYKETLKPSDRPWIGLFCSSSREDLSTPYPALLSLSPGPAMATPLSIPPQPLQSTTCALEQLPCPTQTTQTLEVAALHPERGFYQWTHECESSKRATRGE